MKLKKWDALPLEMQTEEVRKYYDILEAKKCSLFLKRLFDIMASASMLVVLFPFFCVLAFLIKVDSPGPVFYRQERITQYGKVFRIHKFRTMVVNADRIGTQVTVKDDERITKIGRVIRKYRLDEVSQLIDVFFGTMTFVATRPEVTKYVEKYTPEMKATLLLPAGVTSLASIYFKDEAEMLNGLEDTDKIYIEKILPMKMYYNLKQVKEFSLKQDILTLFRTVLAMFGKEYNGKINRE